MGRYTTYQDCPECGTNACFTSKRGVTYKKKCDTCIKKEKEAKEKAAEDDHIAELAKLPISKRLELIERWMYNHKDHGYGSSNGFLTRF